MSILLLSADVTNEILECVLCGRPASRAEATAGRLYADGRQAFAHESHRADRGMWLLGWLRFENDQLLLEDESARKVRDVHVPRADMP